MNPERFKKDMGLADRSACGTCLLICTVCLFVLTSRGAALDVVSTLVTGGNGDHAINPNECNDLSIVVTNNSGAPMTGISAVLSFYTVLGVEITQPYSAYADVVIGGQSTNLAPFQISTLPSYICRDAINLQLTFTTATHGSFLVPLTIPPSGNCTPGSGPCGFCLPPISGSITTDDAVEPSRLSRNLVMSRCAAPKGFPGVVGGSVHYDTYLFTNTSVSDACITVGLSAMCEVMASAYLGSFDPSNIASNYLGDSTYSTSPGLGTNFPFSCTVPAGAAFMVVVNEIDSNVGCTNYVLTLSGLPCASPALAIGAVPNSRALLSWPDSAGGYILESSPSVQGTIWSAVTNEPLIGSGSYNVTNEASGAGKLYRLHKPGS
jgi:hypothetical protein